jgi:hypothetical protein
LSYALGFAALLAKNYKLSLVRDVVRDAVRDAVRVIVRDKSLILRLSEGCFSGYEEMRKVRFLRIYILSSIII